MLVSYVLRVRPEDVDAGKLVGEVEAVASGRRYAVRSSDDLVILLGLTIDSELRLSRVARPPGYEDDLAVSDQEMGD